MWVHSGKTQLSYDSSYEDDPETEVRDQRKREGPESVTTIIFSNINLHLILISSKSTLSHSGKN